MIAIPRYRDEDLVATTVVATLDATIDEGRSLVYCATFALAWRALGDATGGAPARLVPSGELDQALAATTIAPGTLDDASSLARAGEGPSFLATLRRELAERFGSADFGLPDQLARDVLLAYAWLSKDLAFAVPFELDPTGFPVGARRVAGFGVRTETEARRFEELAPQVVIHAFDSPADFVVELRTRAADDLLVVARMPRPPNLRDACRSVLERAGRTPSLWRRIGGSQSLSRHDTLFVPVIEAEIERVFREVEGKTVAATGHILGRAVQVIRVHLDERGARLESSAMVEAQRGGRRGRAMVCEPPFLFALARRGASEPYFAAWIEGAELLRAQPLTSA